MVSAEMEFADSQGVVSVTEKDYLKDRLYDQIDWYDKKATTYKKLFCRLRAFEIIIAASIPVLYYLPSVKQYIPFFAAIITILAGIASLMKFHDNWVLYRMTCESLKYEKFLYLTGTEPYNTENKLAVLVTKVENILSSERILWKRKIVSENINDKEKS